MLQFIKFLLLLLYIISHLWAADINSTILDGNITIFNQLLQKVSKDDNRTDKTSLEKTLLEELIAPIPPSTIQEFQIATDIESYRNLFLYYLSDIKMADQLQKKLKESQKKIQTIESEIKQLDTKDPTLLSNELQDAYYHKKVKEYRSKLQTINDELKQLKQLIIQSLKNLNIDRTILHNSIKKKEKTLSNYTAQINKLQILKEQASLIDDQKKILLVNKKLQSLKESYTNETKLLFSDYFLLFSSYLQEQNNKAFELEKKLQHIRSKYALFSENEIDTYLSPLILSLEKTYMGQIKTLTGASKQEIKDILYQGWKFINAPIFTVNNTPISIFKMALSILIFIFGFIIGSLYKRKISHLASNRRSFTPSTRTILSNLGYYIIITISFFIALNVLGVKLSSIALVAGALSVGIGFGLQNIVSNFVSGLILMFERSIKIGDYIEVDENTRGYVTDIRMRSTTITTNENIDIIIPNQSFIQNNVINWTMSDNIRRFSIPFGVAYGTDVHQVIEVVRDAVLKSDLIGDIVETEERPTRVIMTEMADSSVNFDLLVWVKGDKLHKPKRTISEFLVVIYDALYANHIEIPFPQQDIHIRSVDGDIPILTKKETS